MENENLVENVDEQELVNNSNKMYIDALADLRSKTVSRKIYDK